MATIIAGIDRCLGPATDNRILSEFCQRLEQAGHTAINCGRGPSVTQNGAQSHSGDYMVQLAAGNCLCTATDLYVGVKNGYYHVKKASIIYWHDAEDPATWASKRAWDDNFCKGEPLTLANQYTGRPVKEFYDDHPDKMLYVPKIDKNCTSGTTMAEAYLAAMNGGSVSADSTGENSSNAGGGGSTALDYIKQVLSDDDKYGVSLLLNGKILTVDRAGHKQRDVDEKGNMKTYSPINISQSDILLNTLEVEEYDTQTPNHLQQGKTKVEDKRLLEKYGKVNGKPAKMPSEFKKLDRFKQIKNKKDKKYQDLILSDEEWFTDQLLLLKRGHGHTISFKYNLKDEVGVGTYFIGNYVLLDLPLFGIKDYYVITKTSMDKGDLEAETVSLTLEPAPPSVYVEPTTVNTNKTSTGNPVNVSGNDCNPNDSLETHHWSNHRSHPPKCTRAGLTIRGNSNRQYAKDTAQHNSSSRELVEYVKGQVLYEYYGDNPKGASRCPENMWNGGRPMRGNCADFARLLKCILDVNGYTSCVCHVSDAPGHYYNAIWENGDWTVCDLCHSPAYGHANHGDQKPVGTPDNPAG